MERISSNTDIKAFVGSIYSSKLKNDKSEASDLTNFAKEIRKMGIELQKNTGRADLAHLKKMALWGKLASLSGYLTAWVIPNPISAYLMSVGNFTRWSIVFHPISHGAFDRSAEIPEKYKSWKFAHGHRRYIDWLDWIAPKNWAIEHNTLHHYNLGTDHDPDVVHRNTEAIRNLNAPKFVKQLLAFGLACTWKFMYYAPNTLVENRFHNGLSKINTISLDLWNPLKKEGREIWLDGIIPYFTFKFVLLPSLFLVFGTTPALFVLINTVLAELMANFYSFATIATNHTGEDILTFSDKHSSQADFYLRQILGTVNFPSHNDLSDFLYGGMNYQIEHHLWPDASLLQYQQVRPKLKKLCKEYNIPYREEPVRKRLVKLFDAITNKNNKEYKLPAKRSLKC